MPANQQPPRCPRGLGLSTQPPGCPHSLPAVQAASPLSTRPPCCPHGLPAVHAASLLSMHPPRCPRRLSAFHATSPLSTWPPRCPHSLPAFHVASLLSRLWLTRPGTRCFPQPARTYQSVQPVRWSPSLWPRCPVGLEGWGVCCCPSTACCSAQAPAPAASPTHSVSRAGWAAVPSLLGLASQPQSAGCQQPQGGATPWDPRPHLGSTALWWTGRGSRQLGSLGRGAVLVHGQWGVPAPAFRRRTGLHCSPACRTRPRSQTLAKPLWLGQGHVRQHQGETPGGCATRPPPGGRSPKLACRAPRLMW